MNFRRYLEKLRVLPENQKKIVLWTIVAILAVMMGFFWVRGAINNFSKMGESLGNIELPQIDTSDMPQMPDLSTIASMADWKTYTNDEYGFELKNPETINSIPIKVTFNKFSPVGGTNVTLGDDFPAAEGFIGSSAGKWDSTTWLEGKLGITFYVSYKPVEDLETYVKKDIDIYKSDPTYYKNLINLFSADYSKINLGNVIGYEKKLRFGNENDYDDQILMYVQNPGHLFEINYNTAFDWDNSNKEDRIKIIEKILSTFKFTK